MNLIIDKGNTFCKIAIFNHQIKQPDYVINVENSKLTVALIKEVLVSFPQTNSVIVSSVSGLPWEFTEFFQQNFSIYIETNWQTPVPIINKYTTPQTLGFDRLAAAVGGTVLFPNRNLIVFDAGTALTVEVVNANHEYLGGNISPGL
ncbi:MAG TPA: pantothenate kinase, partial [Bacteroidales bacterium]|nr:pantothenate kinase [Bacteroidales bacterium]